MWKLLHCYIAKLLGVKKQLNNLTIRELISRKLEIKQFNNGFTLIEFLVVLGILLVAVGSSLLFLTSILRGSNQANVTAEVKQNGQVVLDSLSRQIINATDATDLTSLPAGAYDGIVLTRPTDNPLYIVCFNSTPPTSNGWIGVASVALPAVPTLGDYTTATFQDPVSGVDIVNCSLTIRSASPGGVNPAVVWLSFTVNQGVGAPSRTDFLANAQFQTTISLRKY